MDRPTALKSLAEEASRGQLSFPTNVEATLKIQRALDDPDCPNDKAAKLIQTEPLLATRVVAIANSVIYNPMQREVSDVRTAVARLGFRTLRSLTAAVITRQMAGLPASREGKVVLAQLWEHTAHVAALAQVIARRITKQDPETAFFAGLIHEIGGFYLLSRAEKQPELLQGDPADWVEFAEADLGRALLGRLGVPDGVKEALAYYWDGFLALPPANLGDTLLLADALAPVLSPLRQTHIEGGQPQLDAVIGEDSVQGILAESADEVANLTAALKF